MGEELASLNILLDEIKDFNTLEEACLELARKIMESVLRKLDDELMEQKPDYLESKGFKTRELHTRIGSIRLKRRHYRNQRTGGYQFLLDQHLKLRKQKQLAGGLLQLAVYLATKLTYREVAEVIKEAGFAEVSHSTVYNEVRYFGAREAEIQENKAKDLFERAELPAGEKKKIPILFLEADGLIVSSQENGEKNMELKIGLMHEGWRWTSPSKKCRQLVEPEVTMGLYRNPEKFWEVFYTQAVEKYDLSETVVVVNGDGASWIQKRAREYFPEAIVQLDRYHLLRDLRRIFGGKVAGKLSQVLAQGRVDTFLHTLESLVCEAPTTENRAQRRALVKFLRSYKDHLVDYRLRLPEKVRGLSVYGLGAAETYVDKKAANRMKKRGMYWTRKGAHAMAAILALKANKKLKKHLSKKHYRITNPVRKANQVKNKHKRDWSEWLKGSLPAIRGPHQDRIWAKVLRTISY